MLNNNFRNAVLNQAFNYNDSKYDRFRDIANNTPTSAVSANNILRAMETANTDIDLSVSTTQAMGLCICVGTGTTAPTKSDITLNTPISVSDISCSSSQNTYSSNNTRIITSILVNNTASDITITETGLLMDMYINSYYSYKILLDRTVLENPITIPAGESRTLMYELDV